MFIFEEVLFNVAREGKIPLFTLIVRPPVTKMTETFEESKTQFVSVEEGNMRLKSPVCRVKLAAFTRDGLGVISKKPKIS